MKVSIITPTLNAENVIEDAILSVRNQQFQDYEHIIIDACSTDNTLEIVRNFDHLICVSEPDQGIYDAMNKGIAMARGDWIYFLGSDDTLYSDDVLSKVSSELLGPYDVIYGDVVSDRFGGRYGGAFDYLMLLGNNFCHQAMFFHKQLFEKVGDFDLKYPTQSDWDHNLKWFFSSDIKAKHIDLVIANYADGGYSSIAGDDIFQRDKRFNYLKYGYAVLPVPTSLKLLVKESFRSLITGNFTRVYECFRIGARICFYRQG